MFAVIEPWGAGYFAVRDVADGVLLRRGFHTREEADDWSCRVDRADLKEFFYPTEILWGPDYDEKRRMKRIFAASKEEALVWINSRQGQSLSLENLFEGTPFHE